MDRAAPPGVHGRDGPETDVGKQDRRAVSHPHADGAAPIVTDDHVGFGAHPGVVAAGSRDGDIGPVHLGDQKQLVAIDPDFARHHIPGRVVGVERQIARRKKMIGGIAQGATA